MYNYNLAQTLHFEEDTCLSKFMLASIYKVMDEAVEIMDTPEKMKHIARPLWIVQLWLNDLLSNHITPKRDFLDHLDLKARGFQLTYLTPSREFCAYECYTKYIKAFLNFYHFSSNLAPFFDHNSDRSEMIKSKISS